MRKFITNIVAAVMLIIPSVASAGVVAPEAKGIEKRYVIKQDGGGVVTEFKEALLYFKQTGMKVKLDGLCASACTLLLSKDYSLDVCITRNAVFMFHQPFSGRLTFTGFEIDYSIPSVYGSEKMWKKEFYDAYPQWTQKLIDTNGGVPSVYTGYKPQDTFDVPYDILRKNMKTCA